MNQRQSYPTDTTDHQWALLEPLLCTPKSGGRPADICIRDVLDAVLHVVKGDGSWNLLPDDSPPKGAVYHYFCTWRSDGTWQRVLEILDG